MKAIDRELFETWFTSEPNTGCWLWDGATDKFGYGHISIKSFDRIAHRWSWRIYRGEIPKGICVLHHCDVPACVNPDHLFLGTRLDNNKDRDQKGRHIALRGENHGMSKLNTQIVAEIRNDSRDCKSMAPSYRVNPSTIQRIKRRETWKHVI